MAKNASAIPDDTIDSRFARGKYELMVNEGSLLDLALNDINLLDIKIDPPFIYFSVEYLYVDLDDETNRTLTRWRKAVIPVYAPYEPRIINDGIDAAYQKVVRLIEEVQKPLNRGKKYMEVIRRREREERLREKYGNEWSLHLDEWAEVEKEG